MYQLPPEYEQAVNDKLEAKYGSGSSPPPELCKDSRDCTDMRVFSIDPPRCEDVDDALSIKLCEKKTPDEEDVYIVGKLIL